MIENNELQQKPDYCDTASKEPSQAEEAIDQRNAQDDFEKAHMTLKLWGLTIFSFLGSLSYGFTFVLHITRDQHIHRTRD